MPGVGKTSLAKELVKLLHAILLSSDKVRKELVDAPKYTIKEKERVYDVLFLLAKYLSSAGVDCVIDASFFKENLRRKALEKIGIPKKNVVMVECVCPEDVVISRISSRKKDYSDADVQVYKKIKKQYEPIKMNHITIDTLKNTPLESAKILMSKIQRK